MRCKTKAMIVDMCILSHKTVFFEGFARIVTTCHTHAPYIYQHLPANWLKCWKICHTWIVWDINKHIITSIAVYTWWLIPLIGYNPSYFSGIHQGEPTYLRWPVIDGDLGKHIGSNSVAKGSSPKQEPQRGSKWSLSGMYACMYVSIKDYKGTVCR